MIVMFNFLLLNKIKFLLKQKLCINHILPGEYYSVEIIFVLILRLEGPTYTIKLNTYFLHYHSEDLSSVAMSMVSFYCLRD